MWSIIALFKCDITGLHRSSLIIEEVGVDLLFRKMLIYFVYVGHGHSHAGSSHGHSHAFGGGHSNSHAKQVQGLLKNEFESDDFHNDFHMKKKPQQQDGQDGGHGHSHDGGHGHSHAGGHSHSQYDSSGNPQVSSRQIMNGKNCFYILPRTFY